MCHHINGVKNQRLCLVIDIICQIAIFGQALNTFLISRSKFLMHGYGPVRIDMSGIIHIAIFPYGNAVPQISLMQDRFFPFCTVHLSGIVVFHVITTLGRIFRNAHVYFFRCCIQ